MVAVGVSRSTIVVTVRLLSGAFLDDDVGGSRTTGEKVLAWVIRRPELVWARRLNSSETSESLMPSESSSLLRFRLFFTAWRSRLDGVAPALPPRGRPPRLPGVPPLPLPPRADDVPDLLPLGLPPLFLPLVGGVSSLIFAAVAARSSTGTVEAAICSRTSSSVGSALIFVLGPLPPRPLLPPVFAPFLAIVGVGVVITAAFKSSLVTIWLSTEFFAACHCGVD